MSSRRSPWRMHTVRQGNVLPRRTANRRWYNILRTLYHVLRTCSPRRMHTVRQGNVLPPVGRRTGAGIISCGHYTMSSGHASLRGMCMIRCRNFSPFGRPQISTGIISDDIIPCRSEHAAPGGCTRFAREMSSLVGRRTGAGIISCGHYTISHTCPQGSSLYFLIGKNASGLVEKTNLKQLQIEIIEFAYLALNYTLCYPDHIK